MKLKNYLLLSGIVLFVTACSSDDDNNQQMTLQRVEEYSPNKAEYESTEWQFTIYKSVKYYQNGEIVLDSIFDGATGYYSREALQTIGNTKVKTRYDSNNTALSTITYNYDNLGRLLEINRPARYESDSDRIDSFLYNPNGTIIHTWQYPQYEEEYQITYTTNEAGIIFGSINGNQNLFYSLVFEDDDVISIGNEMLIYYDILKPSGLRMNITQSNNYLLENGSTYAGNISKHYIKSADNNDGTYQSTFNDSGYILKTIYVGYGAGTDRDRKEIYYYYN